MGINRFNHLPRMFRWLLLVSACYWTACATPPKPVVQPLENVADPPQETITLDLNSVFRPAPTTNVVVSNREAVNSVCKVIVANTLGTDVQGTWGVKTSGAGLDDNLTRVVRRSVMMEKREVIAGEVDARLSAEYLGPNVTDDALKRFNSLKPTERLILLAEKSGADALLVLERAGVWEIEQIVEVREDGKISVRDRRGNTDNGTGCESSRHEFYIRAPVVGLRAKMISLKKNDASILADIEVFRPLAPYIKLADVEKWRFQPEKRNRCTEYRLNNDRTWECDDERLEIVAWQKQSVWCDNAKQVLEGTADMIAGLKWLPVYEETAQAMVKELFPETNAACQNPSGDSNDKESKEPSVSKAQAAKQPAKTKRKSE